MIRKIYILQSLALLMIVSLFSGNLYPAGKNWSSFNAGLDRAKKENKYILIDFYTDWCHWCKVMDEKTFKDKTVEKKLMDRFVTIRLNAEDAKSKVSYQNKTLNNVELTRYFGINGFPSLAFLDPKGNPVTVIPGYIPADTFLHILNYIDEKCHERKISFEDYVKNGGCKEKDKQS
ncbi:hypothetical protein A2V82_13965 [candidate division KSB1 bacterium RBG_16_48_16]|nr:MAG: hypothetical protein A2V82_13965 [candidate division KSB1 bacterium RBG_16_48_16]